MSNIATEQAKRAKYDGRSKLPEYKIWKGMMSRCYSKGHTGYYKYGGRGIRVCKRWRGIGGFARFMEDMGKRKDGETIDRINVNDDYTPENCRWATTDIQANNKRNSVIILAFGRKQTITQWSKERGIDRHTIAWRMKKGWPIERALTEINQRGYNGKR